MPLKVEEQIAYRELRRLLRLSLVHLGLFIGALVLLSHSAVGRNIADSLPNFDLIHR